MLRASTAHACGLEANSCKCCANGGGAIWRRPVEEVLSVRLFTWTDHFLQPGIKKVDELISEWKILVLNKGAHPVAWSGFCWHHLVMPVTVTIDPKRRLTVTTGAGIVTDAEFIEARRQLLADPDFNTGFDRIWDFHAVVEAKVSDGVITQLVADSPFSQEPICRAVVISERSGPMQAILDFISRTRQASRRIAAFPNLASAEAWVLTARHDLPP